MRECQAALFVFSHLAVVRAVVDAFALAAALVRRRLVADCTKSRGRGCDGLLNGYEIFKDERLVEVLRCG